MTSVRLDSSEYFLDHLTGDLYTYSHESGEWAPVTNIGLHYQLAAKYNPIGKYIVKAPVYHPTGLDDINQHSIKNDCESVCFLKKHKYGHWVFQDVNTEFIVARKTHWDIHSFGFQDPSKVFTILAESKAGPMILEYPHIIATQFDIQKKYPDTLKILKNFLERNFRAIISSEPAQKISVFRYKELESLEHTFDGYVFKKNGVRKEVKAIDPGFASNRGLKSLQ